MRTSFRRYLLTGFLLGAASAVPGGTGALLVPATAEVVLEAVREPGARAVVLNVWATWCAPCLEEFPDLLRLRRAYLDRGMRLVLVSGDFPSEKREVVRFLEEQRVEFETYLKQGDDMQFINGLHEPWSGALPATFIYDSAGVLREFWEGRMPYEDMEKKLLGVLGSPPGHEDRKEPS